MGFRHRRIQRMGAGGWPGHRLIKAAGTTAVLCSLAFSGPARAETTVSAHELQGKIDYCENCHGVAARGFHGFYPIPRLAGQQPEYIKNQLQAFIEHRRTNNIMFNVAHVLSPPLLDALTDSFWKLNPKPLASPAAEGVIAAGRKIYEEGIEKSDVPPCAGCHGPEAKAMDNFRVWPVS